MSVYDVENLCSAAYNRMRQTEELGKQNKATAREIEGAKRHIAKAMAKTAEDLKGGKIARRDMRSQLDLNAYRFAREAKTHCVVFAAFGKRLVEQIEQMLNIDTAREVGGGA